MFLAGIVLQTVVGGTGCRCKGRDETVSFLFTISYMFQPELPDFFEVPAL